MFYYNIKTSGRERCRERERARERERDRERERERERGGEGTTSVINTTLYIL